MADDSKLSVGNMVEFAMGLSMASLFANAMGTTFKNTARMMDNDQVGAPPKYIYVIVDGQQKGPLTVGDITEMIRSGEVTPQTYMWKPGMAEWKHAKDITDISPTFDINPPKAPKAK